MAEESQAASGGLFESLKTLSMSLVSIVHTRLELLSNDVAEEREQLTSFLVLVMVALGCLGVGIILLAMLIVVAFWETHRFLALAGLTGLFLTAGVGLVRHASGQNQTKAVRSEPGRTLQRPAAPRSRIMNNKSAQLAARRQQLVAQVADQRTALALNMEPWRARLTMIDRGVAVLRYIGRTPVLMIGAAFVLAALRPGRIGKWLQRGLMVWQIGRRLRRN